MWSLYLAIGAGSIPVLFLINDDMIYMAGSRSEVYRYMRYMYRSKLQVNWLLTVLVLAAPRDVAA